VVYECSHGNGNFQLYLFFKLFIAFEFLIIKIRKSLLLVLLTENVDNLKGLSNEMDVAFDVMYG
jgi:hypothetical protein